MEKSKKEEKNKPKFIGKAICGHEKCRRVVEGGRGKVQTASHWRNKYSVMTTTTTAVWYIWKLVWEKILRILIMG